MGDQACDDEDSVGAWEAISISEASTVVQERACLEHITSTAERLRVTVSVYIAHDVRCEHDPRRVCVVSADPLALAALDPEMSSVGMPVVMLGRYGWTRHVSRAADAATASPLGEQSVEAARSFLERECALMVDDRHAAVLHHIGAVIERHSDRLVATHAHLVAMRPGFRRQGASRVPDAACPCIVVFVAGKGLIPCGEAPFEARDVDGVPVDVREGAVHAIGHEFMGPPDLPEDWVLQPGADTGMLCPGHKLVVHTKRKLASGTAGCYASVAGAAVASHVLTCWHVLDHPAPLCSIGGRSVALGGVTKLGCGNVALGDGREYFCDLGVAAVPPEALARDDSWRRFPHRAGGFMPHLFAAGHGEIFHHDIPAEVGPMSGALPPFRGPVFKFGAATGFTVGCVATSHFFFRSKQANERYAPSSTVEDSGDDRGIAAKNLLLVHPGTWRWPSDAPGTEETHTFVFAGSGDSGALVFMASGACVGVACQTFLDADSGISFCVAIDERVADKVLRDAGLTVCPVDCSALRTSLPQQSQ